MENLLGHGRVRWQARFDSRALVTDRFRNIDLSRRHDS
jgi:hypothetical protein